MTSARTKAALAAAKARGVKLGHHNPKVGAKAAAEARKVKAAARAQLAGPVLSDKPS